MKYICSAMIVVLSINVSAQSTSAEEKVKLLVFLAQPFCTVTSEGSSVAVAVWALDQHPVTDTSFYVNWETDLVEAIHMYVGNSIVDHLAFWIYPQGATTTANALRTTYNLKEFPLSR